MRKKGRGLWDYRVGLRVCPPRVEIVRLAVIEISFYFRFFVRG